MAYAIVLETLLWVSMRGDRENYMPTGGSVNYLLDTCNEMSNFEFENQYVLDLVAAMIGCVLDSFRAVWLVPRGDTYRFHFVLDHDDPVDREAIDDILADFDALQERMVDIETVVTVSTDPLNPPWNTRFVFGRREEIQRGYDLRLGVATYSHPEEGQIRNFEREFESKKMECAVLIVRARSDSEK